ncbi:MAG TPA: hypothetical protein VMI13_01020 [Solirubrobacteraceae bacterium]|nr:hypothetical protein [Solirubrobacteraceae bacterium]
MAGITTSRVTLPVSQEKVTGRPPTGLFADSVQLVAPDTEADTVVVAPEATVAGDAASPVITGFEPFAYAGCPTAQQTARTAAATLASRQRASLLILGRPILAPPSQSALSVAQA